MTDNTKSPSLLDLFLGATIAEHRPTPAPVSKETPATRDDIVDRRDERGTGHSGDFPNPSATAYRGCF
jgi:hypothetical protein